MYLHENELTLIEREAGKAKTMVEDLLDLYGFDNNEQFMSQKDLEKISCEKQRINWKLSIIFDALDTIGQITGRIDEAETAARNAKEVTSA